MMENTELMNETDIKRRALISKPTDCLGECLFTVGCESFNVFHSFPGRLTCSLHAVTNGTLLMSPHTTHFTTNNSAKPTVLTGNLTGKTSGKEEKNINGTLHCVGSLLNWKAFNDHSNCQKLMFINGGTLNFQHKKCFGLDDTGTHVTRTQPPSCSNLTYYDNTKQFQYNADTKKCVEFFDNLALNCGNHTKKTATLTGI